MRRLATATLLALALAAALVGPGASVTADGSSSPTLVEVGDARLWPYVGPDPSFERRASAINVVVRDDPVRVRRYLAGRGEWNRSDDERVADVQNESGLVADQRVPWRDAPGAHRYVYVADRGWTTERYQLHRGTYFGARDHLRAYGPRSGDWTAIQAHAEHWDWFTITHTVGSVEDAQRRVEAPFLGDSAFDVRRVYYANGDTYDADGWTTVVALALAPLLARRRLLSAVGRLRSLATQRNRRRVALAGALVALPLVVRLGGVLFERHLRWVSPDAVVALWYPVLVGGVPLAAVVLGRRVRSAPAGALAALGFGTGVVLDYAYLGVTMLPIPVAAHRAVAVMAVGLLAAGAGARSDRDVGAESERRLGDAQRTTIFWAGAALWLLVVLAGHLV
ncbi:MULTISPECIES: hypothetical protein [Halorussus]|uniref:hypothetical protein n=1 Tax=Halorussus TaxID=1070314 RepID=UPI000E20D52B|nr:MULTISPECIES: hypothetical protein [Halorussus]NHN59570.1 hypothetical protein [Halorussus sp. JP-T4]